ncbi:MAG TPA: hypothetical protein VJ732_08035 [Bryobacteraceae bacterium]|nr:hypothetical protein [Bryobacteraceae bacterium]
MRFSEAAQVIERAEYLLWVIARQDVENLSRERAAILRELAGLEAAALHLRIPDLYGEVLQVAQSRE